MKNKTALHYIPRINASRLSFDDILESVKQHINSLSETKQKKLKDELENGLAILTTKEQLDMYISSYGEIHRQKLKMAYEQIPHKVWAEGSISVVDYGCGQCIAEMVLSDFLKNHYIDNNQISDYTVIEPSKASLAQGLQYLETFFENSKITAHNISARHLTEDYIRPQSDTVIHIFSNVLDIIEFERHNIARILEWVSLQPKHIKNWNSAYIESVHIPKVMIQSVVLPRPQKKTASSRMTARYA